jgi:predicted phage terminase large subunit-like protein
MGDAAADVSLDQLLAGEAHRGFHGRAWLADNARPLEDALDEEIEAVLQELARRSLWDFLRYWFAKRRLHLIETWSLRFNCEIGEHIVLCDPEYQNTIINMPPRMLKSELFSVAMPAWALGKDYTPMSSMMNLSYAAKLAYRDSRRTLDIIRAPWYRTVFPHVTLHPKRQAIEEWYCIDAESGTDVASRVPVGVDGGVVGHGGNLLVSDDLLMPVDANSEVMREKTNTFLGETLASRLNDPLRGRRLVVAQRLHEKDPCGHLLEQAKTPGATAWKHISIANECDKRTVYFCGSFFHERKPGELLCPERIDAKRTQQLKLEQKENYEGQYNQRPVKMEGGMLKPRWLIRIPKSPLDIIREYGLRTAMYIDYSGQEEEQLSDDPDFHAISIFAKDGSKRYWWLDLWAEQCGPETVCRMIIELDRKYRCVRRVTEKGSLKNVIASTLREESKRQDYKIFVEGIYVPGDIVERVQPIRAAMALGDVLVPAHAPWLIDVETEMRQFPRGAHDDRLQTAALAGHDLGNIREPRGTPEEAGPRPPGVITGQDLLEAHAELERQGRVPRRAR